MTPEIQRKPPLRCCAKCAGWYSARPLCLGIDWSLIPSAQVGGYQPPNRRSQHSKQGHFLRGNAMHLSACLWMWEVLRVGPKSHHTFSIWALKMHLVSCRCIIWSLILPFIRVGFCAILSLFQSWVASHIERRSSWRVWTVLYTSFEHVVASSTALAIFDILKTRLFSMETQFVF